MAEEVSNECLKLLPHLKTEPLEGTHSALKTEPDERPQSPESNCAICLEGFNNKSCTNSCLHEFCYHCLKEWSKIKPECPLCKQRFQTIIHNIRSPGDYDEYHVETPFDSVHHVESPFESVLLNLATAARFPYNNTLDYRERAMQERETTYDRFDRFLGNLGNNSHDVPMLLLRSARDMVVHRQHSYLSFNDYGANVTLRRDVYRHNRWIRPFTSPRIRECSPEFFRQNPAQTHRLVPWLFRELHVLLDVTIDPNAILQEILHLITIYPIRSRQFRDALTPAMGNHTDHFLHEFYQFAISPHDIISYDIVAEYHIPRRGLRCSPIRLNFSSESDDSDVEVVQTTRQSVASTNECGLDLSNRAGPSTGPGFCPSLGSGFTCPSGGSLICSRNSPEVIIEISDSSDSEVEVIHIKPPTPVTITIESTDSEAEVVESITNFNVTGSVAEKEERHAEDDRDRKALVGSPQPSTSRDSSSPPMPCLRPQVRLGKKGARSSSSSSSTTTSSSSSSSSSSTSSSSSDSRRNIKIKKRVRRPPEASCSTSQPSSSESNSESDLDSHSYYRNRKRKQVNPAQRGKKKSRKVRSTIEDSSSDEDNRPREAPRLRSIVKRVKSSSNSRSTRQKK